MSEPLRLEQVYAALTEWNRQHQDRGERISSLEYLLQDQSQQRQRAVDQLEDAVGIPHRLGATLQDVVEEVVRTFDAKLAEERQAAALLRTTISNQEARIATLEADQRSAIDALVHAMELPPHPNRSLGNAVVDATNMVQEAKSMIRNNL